MDGETPFEYSANEWRAICNEFNRIKDQHYLDHAGATLYAESQLHECFKNFNENIYSNPHTSKITEDLIDQVRFKILQIFNTTSNEYSVIFTSGATASLKLVGETFNFNDPKKEQKQIGSFVYLQDNHTSVLGMREIVQTTFITKIDRDTLIDKFKMDHLESSSNINSTNSLLVFPAQCNFNGYKYPLDLIKSVHNRTNDYPNETLSTKWYVCLDAATYASTNPLDLTAYKPDFVCISFYKIFGYPTGLGALIVSKRGQSVLTKKYYGGGTVKIAMSSNRWHRQRDLFHERFEDGTLSFLSIISLLSGFNILEKLIPANNNHSQQSTMSRISRYTFQLAQYLYKQLKRLTYKNGQPVIRFYHDTKFESLSQQGGIINFNILRDNGTFVGFAEVACMASIYNIQLRTGCFCNPGACQRHLQLTTTDIHNHYKAGHICGDSNDLINGTPTGSVRVSIGYMTSQANVDALIKMINECYINSRQTQHLTQEIIQKFYKTDAKQLTMEPCPLNNLSIVNCFESKSTKIILRQICVYPIKSCAAIKTQTAWPLTVKGLKYDREWMIVNRNGVALTQKIEPKLCLIKPEIDETNDVLKLSFPSFNSIQLSLRVNTSNNQDHWDVTMCRQSKVCGDSVQGIDCGDTVAEWLNDVLCMHGLRLIRQCKTNQRLSKINKINATEKQITISLTNQAQFLLINTKSVRWLIDKVTDWNDQFTDQTEDDRLNGVVDRFRGNLIIESNEELEEQKWQCVTIDSIDFHVDGPCVRCQMICIDQWTGERTTEPLRTIAREFNGKMRFGLYLSRALESWNTENKEVLLRCNTSVHIKQ